MREVYLDYAAATPMDPEVLEAMLPYLTETFGNPSAPYAAARRAKRALEDARATLAHLIGARPDNVILTAGATEANNLALASADGTIVTDAAEHESILLAAQVRDHAVVPVTPSGKVEPEAVARALTPKTELVSVELANGEVGTIQPVREISRAVAGERARRLGAGEMRPLWLHTDASQAVSTLSVNVSSLGVDLLTLSAAKIGGPKQVGLLWARDGIALRPIVRGGGQERGVRSGTENVAGVVAFAKALELAGARRKAEADRLRGLRNDLQRQLVRAFPWAVVSGPHKDGARLPQLLHISFPGVDARRLVILLEREGVSVGTGSACAASKMEESHVLEAMGVPARTASGSLRITLGPPTGPEDVAYAADAITRAVEAECDRCGLDPRTGDAL